MGIFTCSLSVIYENDPFTVACEDLHINEDAAINAVTKGNMHNNSSTLPSVTNGGCILEPHCIYNIIKITGDCVILKFPLIVYHVLVESSKVQTVVVAVSAGLVVLVLLAVVLVMWRKCKKKCGTNGGKNSK